MNECGLASQYSGPETTLIQPAFESQLEIRYRTLRVGVASSTANVTLNRPLRHHWGRRDFSAKADCARARGVAFSAVAGFLALSAALPPLEIQHPPKGLWPGVPYVRQTRQSGPSRNADAS